MYLKKNYIVEGTSRNDFEIKKYIMECTTRNVFKYYIPKYAIYNVFRRHVKWSQPTHTSWLTMSQVENE